MGRGVSKNTPPPRVVDHVVGVTVGPFPEPPRVDAHPEPRGGQRVA